MEENSLRLRLKQGEVQEFCNKGIISSTIRFGVHGASYIRFSLCRNPAEPAVLAQFDGNEVRVLVPAKLANSWAESETEGFEARMPLDGNESLYILVEKDYKCLHKEKEVEGDEDCFPHPLMNANTREDY